MVEQEEQKRNILRLGQFYPIRMLKNLDDLSDELAWSMQTDPKIASFPLALDGARVIAQNIKEDFYHAEHL